MEFASLSNSVNRFWRFVPNHNHFVGRKGIYNLSSRFLNSSEKRVLKHLKKEMSGKTNASLKPTDLVGTEMPSVHLKLEAMVTVKNNMSENLKEMVFKLMFDGKNMKGSERCVVLQLVSTELDSRSMEQKMSKQATLKWTNNSNVTNTNTKTYKVEFMVEPNFGVPGAIIVTNNYDTEFFLQNITLQCGIHFPCNSWVQPNKTNTDNRIFFTSNPLLPYQTPFGLQAGRQEALKQKRGDGKNMRRVSDRIYDYDVYNDLGNPDEGREFARPVMGGDIYSYPRRCRTGRPPTQSDRRSESRVDENAQVYVPRDEKLGEVKKESIEEGKMKGILNNVLPSLKSVSENCDYIKCFSEINGLYKDKSTDCSKSPLTMFKSKISESTGGIFKFDPPILFSRDSSCWLRDDEFARQTLVGVNPLSIQRLEEFPPKSKLDSTIYGTQGSALTEEHIVAHLNGMSLQNALEQNKLFILDYHDLYLPFLGCINSQIDRKAYATRTILFLNEAGCLKPIAIELSLPPTNPNVNPKRVFSPPTDATSNWLWQLAKAHVCSNDAGVHQLIHHWLRTHACTEPFIIAAHRQLSEMHPIFKLLGPHMRYTLEINAQARQYLLSAGGIIESFFSSGKHSVEMTSSAYKNWWRFDMEGLPSDLIRRGVAEPDASQEHGVKLLIQDYPYANDGLLIWSAINRLIKTYVNHYYPDENHINSDTELQNWYSEAINVSHKDLRDAQWWPKLSTPQDLTKILTTLIWVVSAHHAAVNFGQYSFGAYVPSRPPLMRKLVPEEHDPEFAEFLRDPQGFFLSSLPSLFQTGHYMSVLHILSTHSPDEEYLGDQRDLSSWLGDSVILDAFNRFSIEMKQIEEEIERRNGDLRLKNRCGAGVEPYELLMPSSGPGITCRGVPNSVSI